MLQRRQPGAIVAARQTIVEGAVGKVKMALDALSARQIVTLDDERTAAMVSNLLVVLCSDRAAQPVVNTGTLYSKCRPCSLMAERKSFPLRMDRELLDAVQRWANADLRSLNGQIEFLLRRALQAEGRAPRIPPSDPHPEVP